MASIPRRDSSISFPTLPASPTRSPFQAPLPTFFTSHYADSDEHESMPPPRATHAKPFPTSTTQAAQLQQRHSIVSDDSSAASSADYFGTNPPTSRPISATTLASSRPSSIASNASSGSHVQGQLISCADLLSPGLASALGLLPSQATSIAFPSSSRTNAGQILSDSSASSSSNSSHAAARQPSRRVRAQSAHSGALSHRRPSLPSAPSINHRISVASVSSFESLPEDEIVQGFLAPGILPPKSSRASSYDRITRSATTSYSHIHHDASSAENADRSASSISLASAVSIASGSESSSTADHHPVLQDSASALSSSTGSFAHGAGPSATSSTSTSTITASSSRPSYFLRRAATAPAPAADMSLLMAHRQRTARELLDTERSFVASLTLIDQEYYQPLLASLGKGKAAASTNTPPPILSRKSVADIFSNFFDILQLSRELLSQLEERLQMDPSPVLGQGSAASQLHAAPLPEMKWDPAVDCIGDILATLAPFLKMYSLFVKNFSSALQRIESEQKTNEAFAKFLKDTDQKRAAKERITTTSGSVRHAFGYGLGFQAHLLTIVQRIPRYKLLVDDLVKSTPETHPDCVDLRRASHMIEQVASYINENVRQHEMVLTMLGLQKSLQGLTEPLVAPGRALIKRGTLMKTCRRNIQPREFFLFTDCLIYASPISGGIEAASAAWTMLAQRGGLYGGSTLEPSQSPTIVSPLSGPASPIESVLTPPSMSAPSGPRARLASVPEPYTPLAGAIFSLAGHQLQFRDKFWLRDCTVVSVEDNTNQGLRHCFEIRTPDKSFAVYAESQTSKEAWVNCIRDARADHMSARRTLKAEEDSIEAKRERRRSLYKVDPSKVANKRLSTQSLGAYLAATHLIGQGQDKTAVPPAEQPVESSASRSVSREREPAPRRSRVDSLPNLLMRPPSFPSFATNGTNLSLANLLASNASPATSAPLRVLEDYNAPVWVPDNRADKCCNCQEAFGMWRRKHHCRLCGQVVCWTCSQRSFLIPSYQDGEPDRPARACDGCYDSVFPPENADEADAAAAITAEAVAAAPDSAEMSSVPSSSTDDSVAQALGAYQIGVSDGDTDADGSRHGSPLTPPVAHDSPAAKVDAELSANSAGSPADAVAGRSALAKKSGSDARPKSLRFDALPPPELEVGGTRAHQDGAVSPTTPSSPTEASASPAQPSTQAVQPASPPQVERRGSASARTSPMRLSQAPVLPARSKSLAGPLASGSPRVMSTEARLNRASALEAHHLFTSHYRNPQIQAATSGSGTFRLVTPRLTTPEAELPPGVVGKRSGFSPSIMDAGYFGGATGAIQEDAEDENATQGGVPAVASAGASPVKTSEPFKPWMLHAMSPAGGAHLRPARKRPLSAAARLSSFYGPLLAGSSGGGASSSTTSSSSNNAGAPSQVNASAASALTKDERVTKG
ncbi:probable Don1-cytokinesis protein Don1 [Sporisorium reilianum SRZ2]|uniref:Probable Don1-cytokinesis protein Don1 n=1 Tax=Sporisorium reilianum (strain SRZ2) TaxID=999809 RepID=E6ZVA4_SPORE|nr:probable Don1-cytokinesis protein Don1 [Sporisorium reilianum SRZ2]